VELGRRKLKAAEPVLELEFAAAESVVLGLGVAKPVVELRAAATTLLEVELFVHCRPRGGEARAGARGGVAHGGESLF